MASEKVHVFNDVNFDQEVLKSDKPVLVDFTATWCGPCKALAPIVDQVATEMDGEIKVGKLDVDESPITAGKYGVRGVPTVMVSLSLGISIMSAMGAEIGGLEFKRELRARL